MVARRVARRAETGQRQQRAERPRRHPLQASTSRQAQELIRCRLSARGGGRLPLGPFGGEPLAIDLAVRIARQRAFGRLDGRRHHEGRHAQAAFGEHDASNLGVKRARNVARVLREDLQFDVREVDLPTKGYVAAIPAPEGSDLVKRVNIDFLPACPHECPCHKGDPLYKPPALQR